MSFQFNGIFVLSPGRCSSPSGTKTSRLVGLKVTGIGGKNFPTHYHPSLTLNSWTHRSWLWEKLNHIFNIDIKHTPPSEEPCPSSPDYCLLISSVIVYSKGHSVFLSGQLLQGGREQVKTNGFHDCWPTVSLFSLVRNNIVWNTMMVMRHSVNPWMLAFAEPVCAGKANL